MWILWGCREVAIRSIRHGGGRMADWVALDTSTDRQALARRLEQAHFAMVSGGDGTGDVPAGLRAVVSRSWQRSTVAGVDPTGGLPPRVMDRAHTSARWAEHPLSAAEPVVRRLLEDIGDDTNLAAICDADGTLLWTAGRPSAIDRAADDGIEPGTLWTEAAIGTNGLGTALQEAHPVQIFSGEHFAAPMHRWVCSAAPIYDPLSGEVLGALDISGASATAHPHSLAVVSLAARAIEQQLLTDAQVHARRVLRLPEASLAVLGRDRGV
ncbi:MAG: GAF domain-containing protein, partial [Herbiconiux sp.]|nr:GAF domain-containing protein [Herbiconiux sp.]